MKFNPGKLYETAIDTGCRKLAKEERAEYLKKREETLKEESNIVISPSRSSFYLDMGNDVKIFQGKCHRQAFLEDKNATPTNEESVVGLRRMRYGQIYETQEHKYEEAGGVLIAKNMRLKKQISDNVVISGELDTLANLDGHKVIVEIKSYDGYYAIRHVQGNKSRTGMPKYDHIAQNMHYLAMIKDHPEHKDVEGVLFHYRVRSDMTPTFHWMTMKEILGPDGKITDAFPVINGSEFQGISLLNLIVRGRQLAEYIKADKLPPRDPCFQYPEENIRYLLDLGEVSKKKYETWQKGQGVVGDWQCNKYYCPYFNLCMGQDPMNSENHPSDEDIIKNMYNSVPDVGGTWGDELKSEFTDGW